MSCGLCSKVDIGQTDRYCKLRIIEHNRKHNGKKEISERVFNINSLEITANIKKCKVQIHIHPYSSLYVY